MFLKTLFIQKIVMSRSCAVRIIITLTLKLTKCDKFVQPKRSCFPNSNVKPAQNEEISKLPHNVATFYTVVQIVLTLFKTVSESRHMFWPRLFQTHLKSCIFISKIKGVLSPVGWKEAMPILIFRSKSPVVKIFFSLSQSVTIPLIPLIGVNCTGTLIISC